jgi:hypothetical protein
MRVSGWVARDLFGHRLTFGEDIAASILLAVSSSVWDAASGSAVPVAMLPLPTLSTILFVLGTRKFNCIHNLPSETRSSNATTVVQRMFSCLGSFLRSRTRLSFFCAVNLAQPLLPPRT